ncbi:MAG: Uma2 family endonuclease [Oscillatoriales cyanobacterium]|nr:MAG: Uma2 family endonuclease [Oscillatoriales cyanobacterium]
MLTSDLNALLDQQALQRQDSECRYITDRVNWEQYETLLTRNGDSSAYRVTYLDGALEIMSPSRRHENRKTRIGNLLEIYFLEADIDYFPFGSTTLRQEEKRGGTEPDEAYCIGTDKEFPDLAIEVVVTSGGLNKLLREEIPVQFVQTCGYEQIYRSEILPDLDIELLAEYVRYPNSLAAVKEFRQRLISG